MDKKETTRLVKDEKTHLAKIAKEQKAETARLAKDEKTRLAKIAKEQKAETARLAKIAKEAHKKNNAQYKAMARAYDKARMEYATAYATARKKEYTEFEKTTQYEAGCEYAKAYSNAYTDYTRTHTKMNTDAKPKTNKSKPKTNKSKPKTNKSKPKTKKSKPKTNTKVNMSEEIEAVQSSAFISGTCRSYNQNPVICEDKKHYHKQARVFHPDNNRGCPIVSTRKFQELVEKCYRLQNGGSNSRRNTNNPQKSKKYKKTRKNLDKLSST